jgi:hypothetical protein
MKVNWKILIALVLLAMGIYFAVDSIRPHSYSGDNLSFPVGNGPVSVTNPSAESVLVQVIGTGVRSFSISSTIDGVSGSSTRRGAGRGVTQSFEFGLPPGTSEFTISQGRDVNFVANTATTLEANIQPLGGSKAGTTLIVAIAIILGALFYISRANVYRWISALHREDFSTQDTQPIMVITDSGQDRESRVYVDNRVDTRS